MKYETLREDMIKAMKAKDKARKDVISSLIAAVKKCAIDEGVRDDISEEMTDAVLLKEMKTAKEQLDTCPKEREDLIKEYTFIYDIVKEYAPSLMSEEEVKNVLQEKYSDVIATKNKGMIMKTVMKELKGKADGKVINKVVADLCN